MSRATAAEILRLRWGDEPLVLSLDAWERWKHFMLEAGESADPEIRECLFTMRAGCSWLANHDVAPNKPHLVAVA